MPSSTPCNDPMSCTPTDNGSSLSVIGKIFGFAFASIIGIALLVCIVGIIFIIYRKHKRQSAVWAQPFPRPHEYGPPIGMHQYPYPGHMQEKVMETPPPSYADLSKNGDSERKV